jgi:23S rRNA (uracil1939-C5)-methyltransferase
LKKKKSNGSRTRWEVEVVDITAEGMGIARVDGLVLMIEGGLPGDRLMVEEIKKHRRYTQARIVDRLVESKDRIVAPCAHFESCGGCKLQHANYTAQLRYKSKQVEDALERIGHVFPEQIRPILPADPIYFYRNKLEFSCSSHRWLTESEIASQIPLNRQAIGFHMPGFFDKVIDIERCLLQDERSNVARNTLRMVAEQQCLSYYNVRARSGFLRTLVVRNAISTSDFMFLLVVGEDRPDCIETLFQKLILELDFVSDWVWIFNPKANDIYTDLEPRVWKGKGYLNERLGNKQYRIGPCSFFQTNPKQAQQLFDLVREALEPGVELLYDLYCGTGTIGIYVSDLAQRIVGVDYVESAITDARMNANLNSLSHLVFESGNLGRMFDDSFITRHGKPDSVVVDPPRAGMDPLVIHQLLTLLPEQIVYVSCNPATQARDLSLLAKHYRIVWLQPVDLFPQTLHVETVANLRRKL